MLKVVLRGSNKQEENWSNILILNQYTWRDHVNCTKTIKKTNKNVNFYYYFVLISRASCQISCAVINTFIVGPQPFSHKLYPRVGLKSRPARFSWRTRHILYGASAPAVPGTVWVKKNYPLHRLLLTMNLFGRNAADKRYLCV